MPKIPFKTWKRTHRITILLDDDELKILDNITKNSTLCNYPMTHSDVFRVLLRNRYRSEKETPLRSVEETKKVYLSKYRTKRQ